MDLSSPTTTASQKPRRRLLRILFPIFGAMLLQGCASAPPAKSPGEAAHAEAKAAYLANDFQRTLAIVEPLAVGGEAWAQYTLGYMYYYGRGVAMDRQMAKQWIQRAAEQGYGPAKQALQRISSSAPKQGSEDGMEAPAQPAVPPGRAPMPTPPPATANPVPAPPQENNAASATPPPENSNPANNTQEDSSAPPGAAIPENTHPAPAAPPPSTPTPAPPAPETNTPPPAPEANTPLAAPEANTPPAATPPDTPPATAASPAGQPPAPSSQSAPAAADHAGSGLRGRGWIAAQGPQHYTVQLVGAGDEAAVVRFIHRHHLERDAAYYVQTRNGKPWYTVIYGSFPDREAARRALRRLPAEVNRASPWVRSFQEVQNRLGP